MSRQMIKPEIFCIAALNENGYVSKYVVYLLGSQPLIAMGDIRKCLNIDRTEYREKVNAYNGQIGQVNRRDGIVTFFQSAEDAEKFVKDYLEDYVLMEYLAQA